MKKYIIDNSTKTIMVVDDTPANLKLLEEMLRGQNYRVVAFPRASMAIRAAQQNPPDLILLDITMPEINGFEMAEQLQSFAMLRDIPIIFISALTDTENKLKAFTAGGVDYITKPFHFAEVQARVETHLQLRQLQLELYQQNQHLELLVQKKIKEISDSQMATIIALTKLAESRDDDTGRHVERTGMFCKKLAEELVAENYNNIDEKCVQNIGQAAALHDIGKVAIPDNILKKPGKLNEEEFHIMKTHTIIGWSTLQSTLERYPENIFLQTGSIIARFHHEKWDGNGYPDRLSGEAIPLPARIMAIADVYDSLRSHRVYKAPIEHNLVVKMIEECSGNHFDPHLVQVFLRTEKEFADIYTALNSNEFMEAMDKSEKDNV